MLMQKKKNDIVLQNDKNLKYILHHQNLGTPPVIKN